MGLSVFPAHHAVSLKPEARGSFTDLSIVALSSSPFKQEEYLEEIIESTYVLMSVSKCIRNGKGCAKQNHLLVIRL